MKDYACLCCQGHIAVVVKYGILSEMRSGSVSDYPYQEQLLPAEAHLQIVPSFKARFH